MGLTRGLRSGAIGVLDQIVLSGTSLVIGLALARELPGEIFGAYAVTLAISLIALSLQVSLITDPLVIMGAARAEGERRSYFGSLLRIQAWTGGALGAGTAALALVGLRTNPASELWATVLGLGIATAPIHIQIFIRSVLLASFKAERAFLNDSIHCALRLAALPLLIMLGLLNPFWVFVAHGTATAISILMAAPLCAALLRARPLSYRSVVQEHWGYGKWMLAASGAHWFSGQSPLVLAAGILSPLAAAGIKASMYLASPVNVALTGLDSILAPRASQLTSERSALNRFLLRIFILTTGGSLLYALLLLPVARPLMDVIYRGRYSDFVPVVAILLADTVIRAMARAPVLRLKVHQDTRRIFLAHALCAVTSLIALGVLTPIWGVTGAALSLPIASVVLLLQLIASRTATAPKNTEQRHPSQSSDPDCPPTPVPSDGFVAAQNSRIRSRA